MRFQSTRPFDRDYSRLPGSVKDQVDKQLGLLLTNPQHPSLSFKRVRGTAGIWEARVNRAYRMTLEITGEIYLLRRVGTHDILNQP